MDKFKDSIKRKYQERLINREKQWPPCCLNKLIRLELIGQKMGAGKSTYQQSSIEYGDIFKVDSGMKQIRKILVVGDAGMGKTTLCTSISEDWANEKILQQFDLLLLLSLRHKKVASASTLSELLKLLHASQNICQLVADSLEENEGRGVLIIADGWDELGERQRLEESFIYELFFGEHLPFLSLILTSRPTASASLQTLPCIDRIDMVRGFNEEKIKEYILSDFSSDQEKAKRLLEQLQYNPLVESVCSVPLNCAIVCHLWRILEEELPTTMTELYTTIILNVVLRNIQKKEAFKNINSLPFFSALPEDLKQSWWLLCEFAFQTLREDQLVFSREELINKFFPHGLALDEKVLCFGLLQSSNPILETGYGVSFHFLHLTFQEFLAAMYLVRNLPDKQADCKQLTTELELFQYGNKILQRFSIVLRFFFGLYSSEMGHKKCSFIQSFLSSMSKRHICGDKGLLLCHCSLEANTDELITAEVLQSFQNICPGLNVTFGRPLTAHDCAAILHVISGIEEYTGMELEFSNCGIKEDQIRMLTDILTSKQGKLQVQELNLGSNRLSDYSVSDLFCRASAAFYSLKNLDLSNNKIGAESIKCIIFELVRPPSSGLSKLNLSDNFLEVSGIQALENVQFSASLAHLDELQLQRSLTNDADINGALLTTSLEPVLAFCFFLSVLDLSNNNLSVPGASALARVISRSRFLSVAYPDYQVLHTPLRIWSLHLSKTNLGDKGLCAFIECLEGPCRFCSLELSSNGIYATGVSCFAQAVSSGRIVMLEDTMKEDINIEETNNLDLSKNPLGVTGAVAVCKILSSNNFQLKEANLSSCQLTLAGGNFPSSYSLNNVNGEAIIAVGQRLCQLLQNDTIRYLDLRDNNFTRGGIHILAAFMYLCPCVEDLRTINCGITSNDLKRLLDILTELKCTKYQNPCRKLETWHLSMNAIDDKGISALVEHLPLLFPCLGYGIGTCGDGIFLHDNPINNISEGMRRLKEEIERRGTQNNQEYFEKKRNDEERERILKTAWDGVVSDLLEAALLMLGDYPVITEIVEEEEWNIPNIISDNPQGCVTHTQEVIERANPGLGEAQSENIEITPNPESSLCLSGPVSHPPSMLPTSLPGATICGKIAHQLTSPQEYATTSSVGETVLPPATLNDYNPKKMRSWKPTDDSSDDEVFTTPLSSIPPTESDDSDTYCQGDSLATTGYNNDKLQQSASLATPSPSDSTQPQLKDLVLVKLIKWQEIGLQLGIEDYELTKIGVDFTRLDDCKREMFRVWLRMCTNPNYHDLIKALKAAGETKAAQELQNKIEATYSHQ